MDHSGLVPGTETLATLTLPATETKTGTVVFVPGGPGEAGLPSARVLAELLEPIREANDVVIFDPRGTGASGPTGCKLDGEEDEVIPACAAKLGARRAFLNTTESAKDIEDLRAALGTDKVSLVAVSYGTKVAGEYARRYPARVNRLVLDSPAPVDGLDAIDELRQLALPRVVREICWPPSCAKFLPDPKVELAKLSRTLARRPLRGAVYSASGKRTTASLTNELLYTLIALSDLDPMLRVDLPAAIASANAGDAAPLLKLLAGVGKLTERTAEGVDTGRLLATTCLEGRLPWATDSALTSRPALLAQFVKAADARGAFDPFLPETVLDATIATACLLWPPTAKPEGVASPGPNVPVLVLSGREDLRTPTEDARRTVSQYPNAQLVTVPDTGHSTLGSDLSGCAVEAMAAFLGGAPAGRCTKAPKRLPLDVAPYIPRKFADLASPAGIPGSRGRMVTAVVATLFGATRELVRSVSPTSSSTLRVSGLRGGYVVVRRDAVEFVKVEWIEGVELSGRLVEDGVSELYAEGPGNQVAELRDGGGDKWSGFVNGKSVTFTSTLID